jgi:hypothetical protein
LSAWPTTSVEEVLALLKAKRKRSGHADESLSL